MFSSASSSCFGPAESMAMRWEKLGSRLRRVFLSFFGHGSREKHTKTSRKRTPKEETEKNIPRISRIIFLLAFPSRGGRESHWITRDFVSDFTAFSWLPQSSARRHEIRAERVTAFYSPKTSSVKVKKETQKPRVSRRRVNPADERADGDDKFSQGWRASNRVGNPPLLRQFIIFASIGVRNLLVSERYVSISCRQLKWKSPKS